MPEPNNLATLFEGPSQTLFVLQPQWLKIHADGGEAIFPPSDFVEFLLYVDQEETLLPFTASEGQTLFVIEDELVHVFGDTGSVVIFPLEDLAAFLEHLTRLAEASIPTTSDAVWAAGKITINDKLGR